MSAVVMPVPLRTLPEIIAATRGLIVEAEQLAADLREWGCLEALEAAADVRFVSNIHALAESCDTGEATLNGLRLTGELPGWLLTARGRSEAQAARERYFSMLNALHLIRDGIEPLYTNQGDHHA